MDDPHVCRGDLYALVVEGFHALDTGNPIVVHTVEDFRVEVGQTVISGARYTALLQARADAEYTTRHCVSNFRLVSQHATSATVAYVVTAYRRDAGQATASVTVADFVDEWIRVDHDWRHRSRSISPTFSVGA